MKILSHQRRQPLLVAVFGEIEAKKFDVWQSYLMREQDFFKATLLWQNALILYL